MAITDCASRAKKSRKGKPKAKTGCQTCKTRHLKCDETRPACDRCTSTGRSCDFLQPLQLCAKWPSTQRSHHQTKSTQTQREERIGHAVVLLPKLSSSPCAVLNMDAQEVNNFDYFRSVCAKELSGYFSTPLWEKNVLQISHSEPSIRLAVVTIGALHRCLVRRSFTEYRSKDTVITYATIHYLQAVKALNQRLDTSNVSWELAIIASILFMVIEVLRDNDTGAMIHLEGGQAILDSLHFKSSNPSLLAQNPVSKHACHVSPQPPENLEDLEAIFSRLDIQASTYASRYTSRTSDLPQLPHTFLSINNAQRCLDRITASMHFILRQHAERYQTLPYCTLPLAIATEVSTVKVLLSQWADTFNTFMQSPSSQILESLKSLISTNVLLIQYLTAWIFLSTRFHRDQLCFDEFYPSFKQIVDLAETIINSTAANDLEPTLRSPRFSFDIGIVYALYFTACKCRDPILRRRAVDLLCQSGREGVYDGLKMSAVARRIIEHEERTMTEDMRIHITGLSPSGIEKCIIAVYCRKDLRGTWHYFGESVRWRMVDNDNYKAVGPEVISKWVKQFRDWHKDAM